MKGLITNQNGGIIMFQWGYKGIYDHPIHHVSLAFLALMLFSYSTINY